MSVRKFSVGLHWFRKGLRVHDNPALLEVCRSCETLVIVYLLDTNIVSSHKNSINRCTFLLESLNDLNDTLKSYDSRLYVIKGNPLDKLRELFTDLEVQLLTFERDADPYYQHLDKQVYEIATNSGIKVSVHSSNTLHPSDAYLSAAKGSLPNKLTSFSKLFESFASPGLPLPPPTAEEFPKTKVTNLLQQYSSIPSLEDLGFTELPEPLLFPGGEKEGLRRLQESVISRALWVSQFEKPNTSPNSLEPATTVLSPYISFGCLSVRRFYHEIQNIYRNNCSHSLAPVSLHAQLLWREFFTLNAYCTPNFDRMEGNEKCIQIPWERSADMILAWKEGRTGYPFIDAIMTQLRTTGWIHHLARHAVACFLTRGDLWQHWEEGANVFHEYLLDYDWALNSGNWQWLSASNFFYQYFRVYSPVAFGKKTDPEGLYIRKWIPVLAKLPTKYIYEPWKAPISVQKECGCVIGKDYPSRIVDHETASKENMRKMKAAYAARRDSNAVEDGDEVSQTNEGSTDQPHQAPSSSTVAAVSERLSGRKRVATTDHGNETSSRRVNNRKKSSSPGKSLESFFKPSADSRE